jgi:hypothetical protein
MGTTPDALGERRVESGPSQSGSSTGQMVRDGSHDEKDEKMAGFGYATLTKTRTRTSRVFRVGVSFGLALVIAVTSFGVASAASMTGPVGLNLTMGSTTCEVHLDEANRYWSRSVTVSTPGAFGPKAYGASIRSTVSLQWSPDNKTWYPFTTITQIGNLAVNFDSESGAPFYYYRFPNPVPIPIAINSSTYFFRSLYRLEWLAPDGSILTAMPTKATEGYPDASKTTELWHYVKKYSWEADLTHDTYPGVCEV